MLLGRALGVIVISLAAAAALAQELPPVGCENWQGTRNGQFEQVCEIREMTFAPTGVVSVDAGPNGNLRVIGSDGDAVRVRAAVHAWGDDEEAARAVAAQVVVTTDGEIRADGPARDSNAGWSVSYEIRTPRTTDLRLRTGNGGIAIADVRGDQQFEARNGGVLLQGLAGNVRGRTTNGGVTVQLTGSTWDGEMLDVGTTNGGVELNIPADYSARLEAGTVNGRLTTDFPITVQGRIGREWSATLGAGGPLVRATTTNGGVRLLRY